MPNFTFEKFSEKPKNARPPVVATRDWGWLKFAAVVCVCGVSFTGVVLLLFKGGH